MNGKKKNLLIIACVLFFLGAAYGIYNLVTLISYLPYLTSEEYAISDFYWIYYGIQIVGSLYCAIVTLLIANSKIVNKQNGYLISVIIISFLCSGLISFILVIWAYNTNSYHVTNNKQELKKEESEEKKNLSALQDKKAEIDNLRHLKECGLISEEEFNQRLRDLM